MQFKFLLAISSILTATAVYAAPTGAVLENSELAVRDLGFTGSSAVIPRDIEPELTLATRDADPDWELYAREVEAKPVLYAREASPEADLQKAVEHAVKQNYHNDEAHRYSHGLNNAGKATSAAKYVGHKIAAGYHSLAKSSHKALSKLTGH